jgi:hypothetical protein
MNSGCQGVDASLDAVAMIVNGVLLTDPDMVEELLQQNGFLEVATIFVQAERTSGFWRFLDRHGITLKKKPASCRTAASGCGASPPTLDPGARYA